jgi:DNA-binding NarL/FixJ family response regulator
VQPTAWPQSLTPREREFLGALASGTVTTRGLAEELVVLPNTIKYFESHIEAKLGIQGGRVALLAWLLRSTLGDLGADRLA